MRELCGEVDPLLPHFSRGLIGKAPPVTKYCVNISTAKYLALVTTDPCGTVLSPGVVLT